MLSKFWNRLSNIGVSDEMSFETQRRIILLNRIAFTLFVIVFTLRTVVILLGFQEFTMQSLFPYLSMLSLLTIPYFNKLGFYRINSFTFCVIAPICFLFFSALSMQANEVVNINHYYLPRLFILSTIILPMILIDKKDRVLLTVAIGVNVLCILLFDKVVNLIGVPFNPLTVSFHGYSVITRMMVLPAILMVLGFIFLTNLNRKYEKQIKGLNTNLSEKNNELEQFNEEITAQRDMIANKNELLENANKKVEQVNQLMTDSILYAEKIQEAVLHDEQLPKGYFQESFIYFKPKQHVSGDFYFFKEKVIDNEKCLIVTAVDCTGHGVPGGFLSMLGITLLNETIETELVDTAAGILGHLRERVKGALNQTGKLSEQRDGMDMALCIYNPKRKSLQYAGARMPLYIVDLVGELKTVSADRQPIGVNRKESSFTNHVINLNGGEMIYLCSDGIQDQFGGPDGKKIMMARLKSLIKDLAPRQAEQQKIQLESYFTDWMSPKGSKKYEQVDDVVLLGMRV